MLTTSAIATLVAGALAMSAFAAPKDRSLNLNLERQLSSRYVLTKASSDKRGITAAGTVLIVRKEDLRAGPIDSLTSYLNTYKEGRLKHSMTDALLQQKELVRTFVPGEAFYLLRVEAKDNGIVFNLLSADAYDGVLYKASVMFPLPKDYLASADPAQIQQVIDEVLTIANQGNPNPQQPEPAPVVIALGQTTDQVVAALGQPEKVVKLGDKEIHVYKDLKVTFLNGKVSDVQ